jgi:hypothetical protein
MNLYHPRPSALCAHKDATRDTAMSRPFASLPPSDLSHSDDATLAAALRRSRELVSAPPALVDAAIALFKPHVTQAAPSLLQRLQGLLQFDSQLHLAAGVRSLATPSAVRQLVFTAPGCDVDLRIEHLPGQAPGQVRVTGQLLGPKPDVHAVLRVGEHQWRTHCDELSEFRFDTVLAGHTLLLLQGPGWELSLPLFDTSH